MDMDKKGGYIGRIKNQGSQVVKAPITGGSKGTGTVRSGDDLRKGK